MSPNSQRSTPRVSSPPVRAQSPSPTPVDNIANTKVMEPLASNHGEDSTLKKKSTITLK